MNTKTNKQKMMTVMWAIACSKVREENRCVVSTVNFTGVIDDQQSTLLKFPVKKTDAENEGKLCATI